MHDFEKSLLQEGVHFSLNPGNRKAHLLLIAPTKSEIGVL
jgi:hypothetical protein